VSGASWLSSSVLNCVCVCVCVCVCEFLWYLKFLWPLQVSNSVWLMPRRTLPYVRLTTFCQSWSGPLGQLFWTPSPIQASYARKLFQVDFLTLYNFLEELFGNYLLPSLCHVDLRYFGLTCYYWFNTITFGLNSYWLMVFYWFIIVASA
jgi:hypothetical protein